MNILVVGSGGREHALVWKLSQSKWVEKVFCAPGNGGIADIAQCVDIKVDDIAGLLSFVKKEHIDLTVVGPEGPLVLGIVDEFEKANLKIFGPSKKAAQLEGSKAFAKQVMLDANISTASFAVCLSIDEANAAIENLESFPVVIKADGLAAGKGVVICQDKESALNAIADMQVKKIFGTAGSTVVIEEFLEGEEVSVLALCNGSEAIVLASSQDHKRIFDNDKGPNTGGMGAYSPAPVATEVLLEEVTDKVIYPLLREMKARGALYRGLLYAGIMVTKQGLKVLEFNARFGDPETQAVLARLNSGFVEAMLWTIGEGEKPELVWDDKTSVCVVASALGYPGSYEKGKVITGLGEAGKLKDVVVFHAGTKKIPATSHQPLATYVTDGGRVLGITALGVGIKEAIKKAYEAVGKINFDGMHYRCDIGHRALEK